MTNDEIADLKAQNPHDDNRAFPWEIGAVDGAEGRSRSKQRFNGARERGAYLDGYAAGQEAASTRGV